MPYIPSDEREHAAISPQTPGQLNYALTEKMLCYLWDRGVSYATMNEIVGALECAKQEFYRRVMVPYEEKKRAENGDVADLSYFEKWA